MTTRESIRDHLLAECAEDYVGVWSVLWEVRRQIGTDEPTALRDATLDVIRDALETRSVQAGTFTPDGERFQPWQLAPEQTVNAIQREWDKLGREPNIGEIAFLTSVDSGP